MEVSDDTVKTRITLMQKPSTSTTLRPEPSQDDDTDSHNGKFDDGSLETLPARQPIDQSPTRTPPRNDVVDTLLNNSSHNEEEVGYEVSNPSTELGLLDTPMEHMETVEDRKRLRQFPLYSDRPLDSPCDPNTPPSRCRDEGRGLLVILIILRPRPRPSPGTSLRT